MKFTTFALLLTVLLVPGAAFAQPAETDDETETEDAAATEEGGAAEEEDADEEEEVEPQTDPDPELSAQETEEGETGESLGVVDEDLEDYDERAVDEEEEDIEDEEEETLPWAASLEWDHSVTTHTLRESAELTYNPTYTMAWIFIPSWTFEDINLKISGRQDLEVELTQSDTTSTLHELFWYDTRLDALYLGIPELAGISIKPGLRTYLPTSRTSRASHRILGLGPTLGVSRLFPDVAAGLNLTSSFRWTHWFARDNVVEPPEQVQRVGCHSDAENCAGGATTTRDILVATFGVDINPIEALTLSTSFSWIWNFGHPIRGVTLGPEDGVITASGEPIRVGDGSATHLRQQTWFVLDASYAITDYFAAGASFQTLSPWIDVDGNPQNPIWNEYSQITVYANVTFDALYQHLSASEQTADAEEGTETAASSGRGGRY